jgi:predicted ATPase
MKISSIYVSGLFDTFDHRLEFKADEPITIMIGPNGYGKTMILRIIDTLFNSSPRRLSVLPFKKVDVSFDDGTSISVLREAVASDRDRPQYTIKILFMRQNNQIDTFLADAQTKANELEYPVGIIDDLITELSQVGATTWRHLRTGETLSLDDVLDRYESELPRIEGRADVQLPDWLAKIRAAMPVRFIATERLTHPVSRREWSSRAHRQSTQLLGSRTVRRYSEELAEQVQKTLTKYGALAQSLDRTFPGRLVAGPAGSDLAMDELRRQLDEIDAKRKRLEEAGLLKQDSDAWGLSVPNLANVDPARRGVLAVYATDARKKLSVFDDIYVRVDTLTRIANKRFLHKKMSVGVGGMDITSSTGARLQIEMLSSGEQHELIILYDLLFRVPNNSFILIDEPELSLHVAWQDEFLNDLEEIAKISQFHALLATHSPQIIGDRWDLTVELKGPNGDTRPTASSHSQ